VSSASINHIREELDKVRGAADGGDRYRELLAELDDHFWKECEAAAVRALPEFGDELQFGAAERLLLDAGLVDVKLVHRAGRNFLERLTSELNEIGDEGVFYLTEWLSRRYSSFLATRKLPGEEATSSMLLKAADRDDTELAAARSQRNELYSRLVGLFRSVPGVGGDLAEAVARGAVDDRIEELLLAQAIEAKTAAGAGRAAAREADNQARRFEKVVQNLLRGAREHTEDEDLLLSLKAVAKLRMAVFRRSLVLARGGLSAEMPRGGIPAGSRPDLAATRKEAEQFIRQELHVLRSVLHIGSREGQVESICSVLLNDVRRTTKRVVGEVMELVGEVDPHLSVAYDMLVAPFTGSGFFEWDRNTLVVALTPARSAEYAVVNAVANFRLLSDARSVRSPISSAYRDMYGPDYRAQFLKDYRNWVLRVARGRRESLTDKSYRFFVYNIAPPPSGPIVPREVVRMTVDERREEAKRLGGRVRGGSFTADEAFRLGILLWQREMIDEAIRSMEKAIQVDPDSGRALYSLGVLCRKKRLVGSARKAFRDTIRHAPDSLWGIYAREALRRIV
jgi:tetratricopeptide (TPR) repeat protein